LANGVGLDTPASCVEILQALQQAGYHVENLPPDSQTLMEWLTAGRTNDPEGFEMRAIAQDLSAQEYRHCWQNLPEEVQKGIANRWGLPPDNSLPIPGIQLGNIFIGIQPSRGYDNDPALSYHAPDLEPTHHYLAFYHWLQRHFEAQAIVHVGKHGNLEWLPGKSVALSKSCYPEVALGAIPHFYPFIVNDPGEGSQAKRRSQAVILDHLTPPMTRAQLYSSLQALENLVDEYYQAEGLDPSRLPVIRDRITSTIQEANLDKDLNLSGDFPEYLTQIDAYLCDLKEAQIRDGLHIFGKAPQGRQLRDLIVAIARYPGGGLGIIDAIAQDWGIEAEGRNNLERLEAEAARLVDAVIAGKDWQSQVATEASQQVLQWIATTILPHLQQTSQEIANLLQGLAGRYVPSGVAGAPTRGRPEVLPTGRNFYSVDIRAIPTESAWEVGSKAAETLIERYTQENGEYPQTLGLSVWGTSTMRTGGDDIAEALALLGVRPVWEGVSRRVVDWEILPVSILGRPRVDVTLRVSGFFRDAFPNLIDLFDRAAQAVAALPESAEENPLAAQVSSESQTWQQMGFPEDQARRRASYRVFGSKPGAYGAGLQGLIEGQNWETDEDLARAYVNWSCYAYAGNNDGTAVAHASPEAFENRLQQMQVILHNQDNREHDLLDSDDYYQFQGGMTVAARSLQGHNPQTYFGDNSRPDTPRIRSLREQLHFVYRSRVVNPKWLQGVMRHGYKGAFEMSATVDYLFAYDATTQCAEDFMYEGVAQAYVLDEQVQEFVKKHNPWALRDMAERLLEANQRQMWSTAPPDMLEQLRAIALDAEASVEGKLRSSDGE
jgi:cobaltochelatase CobN